MERKLILAFAVLGVAVGTGAGAAGSGALAEGSTEVAVNRAAPLIPQCANTLDDDGDGRVDYPDDPDCSSPLDDSESSVSPPPPPPPPPACSDGHDNDGDGLTDLNDPGCSGPNDDSERNANPPPPPPACSDGKDNDGDGLTDSKDPGCSGPNDDSERNQKPPPPPPPPPGGGGGHVGGRVPAEFFGLVGGGAVDDRDLAQIHKTGVRTMRVGLSWPISQQGRGRDFAWPDGIVRGLVEHGIRPVFTVFGSPAWATGSKVQAAPPLKGEAKRGWKTFLKAAVKRYGPKGSYWREQPGLPKKPVRAWQIWNEPNLPKYFSRKKEGGSPRLVKNAPKAYAKLIKSSDEAISKVDEHAKVVLAGLSGNPKTKTLEPGRFLKKFLKAPGITKHFDAASLHPYTPTIKEFKQSLKATRRALKRGGAKKKGLWLTEVGWGSATDRFPLTKGRKGQAKMLRKSFKFTVKKRKKMNIQRVFWFFWRDPAPAAGRRPPCTFCFSSGLLTHNGHHKPAYKAFKHYARMNR
jgi:Glycosyl hydrolase catalytic core